MAGHRSHASAGRPARCRIERAGCQTCQAITGHTGAAFPLTHARGRHRNRCTVNGLKFRQNYSSISPVRFLRLILVVAACLAQPLAGQATDSLALARRVVAAASLAAKEYALGVVPAGGQITQPEEVEEAKLFIQQAQFDVSGLPVAARANSERMLARIGRRLDSLAPPEVVSRVTDSLVARITAAAGGPRVVE